MNYYIIENVLNEGISCVECQKKHANLILKARAIKSLDKCPGLLLYQSLEKQHMGHKPFIFIKEKGRISFKKQSCCLQRCNNVSDLIYKLVI